MKEKPKFGKEKILHFSKKRKPISNYTVIHKIAYDMNMSPEAVKRIVEAFFGVFGLKYFMARKIEMNVKGLGKFYFHKKTFNSYHKKMFEKRGKKHEEFMNKYNTKLKK